MVRWSISSLVLIVAGCGLERDWDAWQKVADAEPAASTGASTGGPSSTSSSGAPGETTTGAPDGDASGDGTHGGSTTTSAPDPTATTGTGEPPAVCGDGEVQPGEECDDPGDLHCHACVKDRRVFITSKALQGDFALSGLQIDYWCHHLAGKAGLSLNGQPPFKAWVSTSEASAAERISHSRGRYVLLNDQVFAESWDALVAGQILHPLNIDEYGNPGPPYAMTDTYPDGSAIPGEHCDDWTSDGLLDTMWEGRSSAVDGQWTVYTDLDTNPTLCIGFSALYCFESP
jgi:hypothetical protein